MLSDTIIKEMVGTKEITISPFNRDNLGPNSYDCKIDNKIKVIESIKVVDSNIPYYRKETLPYILKPGETMVFQTQEKIGCKEMTAGLVSARSNMTRLGLIFNTSSLLDTGFVGRLSGSIHNPNKFPVIIYPNYRIIQVMFFEVRGAVEQKYNEREWSKNLNQDGSEVPEFKLDKEWL